MSNTPNPLVGAALTSNSGSIFSLHHAQMNDGRGWTPIPARLFLQQSETARIVSLCNTGNLYETHAYSQMRFRLGQSTFADRRALLAYFLQQHELLTVGLAQTGAVLLGIDGSVQVVAPGEGRVSLSLEQQQQLVGGDVQHHYFEHGPFQGHSLVLDEDGKGCGLPINALATRCWLDTYTLADYAPVDVVVGPVLLVRDALLRSQYDE